MQQSISRHGEGKASGIRYGKRATDAKGVSRQRMPEQLYGCLEATEAVIAATTWNHRYVAGVLGFAEHDLPRTMLLHIIREHLAVLFPGVDPARISATYIKHMDGPSMHIHFWIACTDLGSRRQLTPYFHRADVRRCRLWVQSINDLYGLGDPNDPNRWRLYSPSPRAPVTHRTAQDKLQESLHKLAATGLVRSRRDIEQALVSSGWTVSRRCRNFISVTAPGVNKPIRLTGRMFSADWSGEASEDAVQRLATEFAFARAKRTRDTAVALLPLLHKKLERQPKRLAAAAGNDPLLARLQAIVDTHPDIPQEAVDHDVQSALALQRLTPSPRRNRHAPLANQHSQTTTHLHPRS